MVANIKVLGNKINLCDSCKYEFANCPTKINEVLFGDGKGNDNVVCCPAYKPIKIKDDEDVTPTN